MAIYPLPNHAGHLRRLETNARSSPAAPAAVSTFETRVAIKDQNIKPFDYLCAIPMLRRSPEPLRLTARDPKAKAALKLLKPGQKPPRDPNKTPRD